MVQNTSPNTLIPPVHPKHFPLQQHNLGKFHHFYLLVLTFLSDLMKQPKHEGQQKLVNDLIMILLCFSSSRFCSICIETKIVSPYKLFKLLIFLFFLSLYPILGLSPYLSCFLSFVYLSTLLGSSLLLGSFPLFLFPSYSSPCGVSFPV